MAYENEDQQVEALKKWWQENWKALVAGLGLGVGAIVGWEAWSSHKLEVAGEASRLYEELDQALTASDTATADEIAGKLKTDYAGTPYAALAAMELASHLVETEDLEAAQERLNWVVQRSGDEGLRHVARLRRARVLWSMSRVDEALALLKVKDSGDFAALYAELRGDINYSTGNRSAARSEYEQAMAELPEGAANRDLLQRKLDDLADVVKS